MRLLERLGIVDAKFDAWVNEWEDKMYFDGEVRERVPICRACGTVHEDGECPLPQWLVESLGDMPPDWTVADVDEMENIMEINNESLRRLH